VNDLIAYPERHPEHVSVSELREFLSCPLRWWYKYRLGLWTDKTTPFFALGTAVHAGLQMWYEPVMGAKKIGDLGKAYDHYAATYAIESAKVDWIKEKDADPIGQQNMGKEMLRAALTEGDDWKAHAVERTMFAEIKHSRLGKLPIKLKAQVDMITESKDVVEHKTASRRWEEGREHGDVQATAYVLAVRENFGHDPEVTFNIISKHAKAPVVDRRVTHRGQDDLDKLYISVRSFLDAQEKGVYPNPTAFAHATCEYRRICDQWESHPQKLPERTILKNMVPGLREARVVKE
jgi:CRISPR/Cas system-associated exonuclease Cas4 (RecB family)